MRQRVVERQIWIGLVNVVASDHESPLADYPGAYANVLAYAGDKTEFESRVRKALAKEHLEVTSFEDSESLAEREENYEVNPEIRAVKYRVREQGGVFYDALYTYDEE